MADPDEDDWLASAVEYTTAEVLYGSPCGFAVPLGKTYWCEPIQRLISEQCTTKEIDSFLSPDCNQIYGVEQAEMFDNKSLNSFECPRCSCTLTVHEEEGVGFYLYCSFCRWDSLSLEVQSLGIDQLVDDKPDELVLRLMKLEKVSSGDADMKRLLADFKANLSVGAAPTSAEYRPPRCDVQALSQEQWKICDLEKKLDRSGASVDEKQEQQLREMFDETSSGGSSIDRQDLDSILKEMDTDAAVSQEMIEAALGADDGSFEFDQLVELWRRIVASKQGPTLDEILISDAERFRSTLGGDPALSAPLAQRFTQPRVQPELVRHLLPRRKPLIPRMTRRALKIYKGGLVVKPADNGDGSGAQSMRDELERKFDLLELGLDHVPQFYVAELPDAEEITTRPTSLQLTITNPLDVKCTLRLCDGAVGARLAAEHAYDDSDGPVDTIPGKHRAPGETDAGINAQISMVDGSDFAELTVAPKPLGEMGSSLADPDSRSDTSEGEPSCVVVRNGNRVTIQCLVESLSKDVTRTKKDEDDALSMAELVAAKSGAAQAPRAVEFDVYFSFSTF